MDIRQLQVLCALAHERHFARAAERCAITQPTLSARLRQLEGELGIPIVKRGARFEGFTPEGQRVLDWARSIVGQFNDLKTDVQRIKVGLCGTMELGVIPTALLRITPLVQVLHAEYPELHFCVRSLSTPDIMRRLSDHELAIGVTYIAQVPNEGYRTRFLYDEGYQLLFSPEHHRFPGDTVTWAQAAQLPLALLTPEMQNRQNINDVFSQIGHPVRPVLESDSLLHICANVASGTMVGIVAAGFSEHIPLAASLTTRTLIEPDRRKAIGLVSLVVEPESPFTRAAMHSVERIEFK